MRRRSRDENAPVRVSPKERTANEAKLRRTGSHCPVCLQALPRISGGRVANNCASCGAQAQPGKRCTKCHQEAIWEGKTTAACQACAHHGSKVRVIANELDPKH